jgi:hypothetical protein
MMSFRIEYLVVTTTGQNYYLLVSHGKQTD